MEHARLDVRRLRRARRGVEGGHEVGLPEVVRPAWAAVHLEQQPRLIEERDVVNLQRSGVFVVNRSEVEQPVMRA